MTCGGINCTIGPDDKCIDCGNQWAPAGPIPWYLSFSFDDTKPIWSRQVPCGAIYTQQAA